MATLKTITVVDDIDGSAEARTVPFALDGTDYEIDLGSANAQQLRDALAPYIKHAQKVSAGRGRGRRTGQGRSGSGFDRAQLAAIRHWARENGYKVSDRGRLPKNVIEAFQAAH